MRTAGDSGGGSGRKRPPPALPMYHVTRLIRYLHLERDYQRQKLLPELTPEIRGAMVEKLDSYRRKPHVTLATFTAVREVFTGTKRWLQPVDKAGE